MRSSNVYEERSLGIFEAENDDIENEADYPATDSRVAIWGRYLGRHVRRQLSFGALSTRQLFFPSKLTRVCSQTCGGSLSLCFSFVLLRCGLFVFPCSLPLSNGQIECEYVGLTGWAKQRGQLRNPENVSWFTIFAVCTSRCISCLAHALLTYTYTYSLRNCLGLRHRRSLTGHTIS